jgi:hypothetical protein
MTNSAMARFIRVVNSRGPHVLLAPAPEGSLVRKGRVWRRLPDGDDTTYQMTTDLYFVFDGAVCVGAVMADCSDIHSYTVPSRRRQGLMLRALRESVLPDLARDCATCRVSFHSQAGRALWRKLGGQEADGGGTIDLAPFKPTSKLVPHPRPAWTNAQRERVLQYMELASQLVAYTRDVLAVVDPGSRHPLDRDAERVADAARGLRHWLDSTPDPGHSRP